MPASPVGARGTDRAWTSSMAVPPRSLVPAAPSADEVGERGEPGRSRAQAPLRLVRVGEARPEDSVAATEDVNATGAPSGIPGGSEETASGGRFLCAFCAEPLPESGKVCCAEYANSLDDPTFYGSSGAESLGAGAAPAREAAPHTRFVLGSQFLVGLLVICVGALALMLVHQGRIAEERAHELEATRRLSEEMIALMKETRLTAAKPVIEPEATVEPSAAATGIDSAAVPPAASEPGSAPAMQAVVEEVAAAPRPAPAVVSPAEASRPSSSTPDAVAAPSAPATLALPRAEPPRETRREVPEEATPPESTAKLENAAKPKPAVKPKPMPATVAPARPMASPAETEAVAAPSAPVSPSGGERTAAATTSEPVAASARPDPRKLSDPEAEERIRQLASRTFPSRQVTVPRPATVSIPWQKLERGMSHEQVESLLGKPRWVESLMIGEFWLYGDRSILGRGWVVFSEKGAVMQWSTP